MNLVAGENILRIFKTKWFTKFARKECMEDATLVEAIREIESGWVDADYGGELIKKRIAREGSGKSGGYRTLIAYRTKTISLFLYGFAKSDEENIADNDLKEFKIFTREFGGYDEIQITSAIDKGTIKEIEYHAKKI
jgi:hypothetical protein